MASQAELKRWRRLSLKKFREDSGRFVVQGRKVVAELLKSAWTVEAILASEAAAEWVAPLARGVAVHTLAGSELDRIGTFEKGNELVAVTVAPPLPDFRAPTAGELMLALDGVRDPRNLGSLVRIADWFGIKRIICSADCMEIYNPKVVQSTMGSLFRTEVRKVPNLAEELTRTRASGARTYIADMDGTPIYSAKLSTPSILVLGSESHGHSAAVAALQAEVISIPRIGQAESLNVAMAAAALCTEFTRQSLG